MGGDLAWPVDDARGRRVGSLAALPAHVSPSARPGVLVARDRAAASRRRRRRRVRAARRTGPRRRPRGRRAGRGRVMQPPAEMVHWLFAAGLLLVALCLLSEVIVGERAWRRRWWRVYLWPSLAFTMGVLMWPVMVFFTNSAIHMLAHGAWAQTMMVAGAAELGLARGKLVNPLWRLAVPVAFL